MEYVKGCDLAEDVVRLCRARLHCPASSPPAAVNVTEHLSQ